jgi:hypothetical protein
MSDELAALVCDLRWAEAKTRQFGSAVGVEADLALVDAPTALATPTATALAQALRHAAHLLGPIDPPDALGATLSGRLHGVPGLEAVLGRYRSTLPRPRLEPAWPLPDLTPPSATVGHAGSVTSCAFSPQNIRPGCSTDSSNPIITVTFRASSALPSPIVITRSRVQKISA